MKLKEIRTFVVGNPPPGYGGRYFVFVKLTTDGNVHGVGEAYCVPFHPDLVARMAVDVFERYLLGEDPHDIESLWRRVYSAGYTQHPDLSLMGVLSALEMACWDIIGKEAGQPVYNLLGGRVHERLRSYTYIYARPGDRTNVYQDPDLAAERAAEYLAQGFTALKFDIDAGSPVFLAGDWGEGYDARHSRGISYQWRDPYAKSVNHAELEAMAERARAVREAVRESGDCAHDPRAR
ncbi:MAG: hypothetical protein E6K51_00025 [Gammaproteobacteria bacterium]|nr:MAG: hypothetical protein E6K51_00025 [Gammaproteobacteria bacterium]